MSEPIACSTDFLTPETPSPVLPSTPGIKIIAGVTLSLYLSISSEISAANDSVI